MAVLSLIGLRYGDGFVPELVIKESPLAYQVKELDDGPDLENFHVGFCTWQKSCRFLLSFELSGILTP